MTTNSLHRWYRRACGSDSGAALGVALMVMLVLSVLGLGLLNLATVNGVQAERVVGNMQSFWAAEAGLQEAKAIGVKYARPYEDIPGLSMTWSDTVGNGSYQVTIVPDALNGNNGIKHYTLVSTGTSPAGESCTVRQDAEIETIASFMWASIYERLLAGGLIYFGPGDVLIGRLYTNDRINIYGGSPNPDFPRPAFLMTTNTPWVLSATNSVNYANGADVSVFHGGLMLNAPPLNYNVYTNQVQTIRDAATSGGIALTGNYSISFTNTLMRYRQIGSTNTLTRALSSFNGAVYVSGYVTNLGGTVDGDVTIASDSTIYITTNLVYQSAPPNATLYSSSFDPTSINDSLGLVARNAVTVMGRTNINIHAAVLITQDGDGFNADRKYELISSPPPLINLFGSISQFRRGVVGRPSGEGFLKNYKYNARFLTVPPWHFPHFVYTFESWRQDP